MAVALRVSPDLLLEREIVVPLAAEQDLRRVITYEMDRLTPFRADEVFWTCDADRRDPAQPAASARDDRSARPGAAGFGRVATGGAGADADRGRRSARARHIIPLDGKPRGGNRFGPRTDAYALGGCGVLAVAAVALPFIVQSIAWTGIDARIEAMRPQVALAEALRKQIANSATLPHTIAAARVRRARRCIPSPC